MTYKQIEAAREARLWFTQIVAPTAMVVVTALSIPEVRQGVAKKYNSCKTSIANKFKKKES